jgi:hypothetical protein
MLPLPGSRYARTVVIVVGAPNFSGLRGQRRLAKQNYVNQV